MGKLGSVRQLLAIVGVGALVAIGCAEGADPNDCTVGSEGCECTLGGACDPGLQCLSKFCVDPGGAGGMQGSGSTSSKASSGSGPVTSANATTGVTSGPTTGPSTSAGPTSGPTTVAATSTGSGTCSVPNPTGVMGCTSCGACDTWTASWADTPGATHYRVKFFCGGALHESPMLLGTSAELCYQATLCSYCSNGLSGMWIEACDDFCCSSGTPVPEAEAPLGCQVDCCL